MIAFYLCFLKNSWQKFEFLLEIFDLCTNVTEFPLFVY